MGKIPVSIFILIVAALSFSGCDREPAPAGNARLSYGDSVFYVRDQSYVISPNLAMAGTYSSFPDNLLIDPATGKITVTIMGKGNESQTGLRYKIRFEEAGTGKADSTYIVLAGLNYLDQIYNLSANDSIIRPVYNADLNKNIPSGTYGIQADNELEIDPVTGAININECIRRGLFNLPAENGEWEEVSISYRSNDNSNNALNRIDIALYYYNSVSDIPSNISQLMRAHQKMVLGVNQATIPITTGPVDNDLPDNVSLTKPRPPCVIIIGQ